MTGSSISAGAPCVEPDKLYVEVAGTDVHPGYGLVLEKNGDLVSTLAMTQKQWHQRYECDYAVDGAERFDHTLTLTVEKEQGGHLRLPLLDEPRPTRLSARTQPNLLFPIYPLARMPWVAGESGHALLRPGYLYVFWKGILWRELQTDENGKLQDVDLVHWREQAKSATQPEDRENLDDRPAVGIALDTLWVPARFQQVGGAKWTIGDVELAWSEEQWSWDYIESLESGNSMIELPGEYREWTGIPSYGKPRDTEQAATTRRSARCVDLSQLRFYEHRKRFGPDAMGSSDWLPAHNLAVSRQRNVAREIDASDPCLVTRTLDGTGLQSDRDGVLYSLRDELEHLEGYSCKAQEAADFAKGFFNWMDEAVGEEWQASTGGDQSSLFSPDGSESAEQARRSLLDTVRNRLQPIPEDEDRLAIVQNRHIAAVPVPDDLFELAWLTNQSSLRLNLMSTLVESTQKHPHFKSAMLLHSALFDKKAYERGPFDDYKNDVNMALLDEALRKSDREACRQDYYDLVERRIGLLESRASAVFNDLFSLNKLRYPIALATLNLCMTHLETSVFTFDQLAGKAARDSEAYKDTKGAKFIVSMVQGKEGLSHFLEDKAGKIPMDRALAETLEDEPNDGSGKLRPALIQRLASISANSAEVPDALREQYEVSKKEKEDILKNIARLGDSQLLQWAQVSYTTWGQLMADLTSEFYQSVQRAILRSITSSELIKSAYLLEMPARLMKLGNPFMHGLVFKPSGVVSQSSNLEVLGMRFGTQATGVGQLTDEAIKSYGASVANQPAMSQASYDLIRTANNKMIAAATPAAGTAPDVPNGMIRAEMFLADKDSVAAKVSRGLKNQTSGALMRYAPPGMLALFGWNVLSAVEDTILSFGSRKIGEGVKGLATVAYGATNLMYWLGHIVEAQSLEKENKLSWLTNVVQEVDKLENQTLKSIARVLLVDQFISVAKVAGRVGALLEVVLSIWNGVQRVRANDHDAAAGFFTAGAGFLVYMFAHKASSAAIPLLGVSFAAALGFVSLVVALGALVWAIFRTDGVLEAWIKNGPFGTSKPAEQFLHLHERPEDAFQFLVGGLFPVRGVNRDLSHYEAGGLLSQEEKGWMRENNRVDGHVIAVDTAAFILMDNPGQQFKAHFWQHPHRTRNSFAEIEADYVYYDADNYSLRFHFPKRRSVKMGRRSIGWRNYTAKIQILLSNGGILPVTDLDEPLKPATPEPEFREEEVYRWITV